jgi:hypothetical protein
MTKEAQRDFAAALKQIAERLDTCQQVKRYDTPEEKQAWTLAHSFLDLAESFSRFLNEQLPRLKDEGLSDDQINELLIEIGEEFRHILYHLRDPEFYAYLRD